MQQYDKILVAVDLTDDAVKILNAAKPYSTGNGEQLVVVYVLEPMAAAYPFDTHMIDLAKVQAKAEESAQAQLKKYCDAADIANAEQYVLIGNPAAAIKNKAPEVGAELVILGSHGTSGWKLLLGSTANSVLHGAECDVLTVRIGGDG